MEKDLNLWGSNPKRAKTSGTHAKYVFPWVGKDRIVNSNWNTWKTLSKVGRIFLASIYIVGGK